MEQVENDVGVRAPPLDGVAQPIDVALTGRIMIMGKVLPVGGFHQKIRAAYDAGVKEAVLAADNVKKARGLPSYIVETAKLTPVRTADEVLTRAFVLSRTVLEGRFLNFGLVCVIIE